MKKSKLLFAFVIMLLLSYIYVPQLRGTIYLSKDTHEPKDWLSSLTLKLSSNDNFEIPKNISTIYLTGKGLHAENRYSKIKISDKRKTKNLIEYKNNDLNFTAKNDTLFIDLANNYKEEFNIFIDSTIKCMIADNIKSKELNLETDLPIEYIVKNKSNIDISRIDSYDPLNYNQVKFKMTAKGNSTVGLTLGFKEHANIHIVNSMVYIRQDSQIDTLRVDLLEKSNIIFQDRYRQYRYSTINGFIVGIGSSSSGGTPPIPNKLIIDGNLKYYNLSKDNYKSSYPNPYSQQVNAN